MNVINHFNHTNVSPADIKRHHKDIKSIKRAQNGITNEVRNNIAKTLAPSEDNIDITTPYLDTPTR